MQDASERRRIEYELVQTKLVLTGLATQLTQAHALETVLDIYDAMGKEERGEKALHGDYVLEKVVNLQSRGFGEFWLYLDEQHADRLVRLVQWRIRQRAPSPLGDKPTAWVETRVLIRYLDHFKIRYADPNVKGRVRRHLELYFRGMRRAL